MKNFLNFKIVKSIEKSQCGRIFLQNIVLQKSSFENFINFHRKKKRKNRVPVFYIFFDAQIDFAETIFPKKIIKKISYMVRNFNLTIF